MNLSDIIKDKDATISRLQSECNEKSDMIFKLTEQLHQINLRKTQECEKLKEQLMQKDEVNTFFNTPIKGWSDDPCEICPCKNELQLAEQLITGILRTLNLEAYDWRADQNEILTEIRTFKQECEQKDKEIKGLHLIIDRLLEASGYDKHISSAEDFEDVYKDMGYKLGLIDELKQECEELKAYAQRQENQREEYYKEYLKKDKALEEIEEIADVLITETNEYESCYYKNSCGDNCYPRIAKVSEHSLGRQTYCQYEAVAKILDIINKAKGDTDV